jgi:hypothetical protein
VGGPEVVVVLVVTQHVVGGGEHGGGHRDDGLHRTAAMLEAQELGAQIPVAPPHRRPRALNEDVKCLRSYFGGRRAVDIDGDQVQAYTDYRLGDQAKPATINRELAALKRMFTLAVATRKGFRYRPYIPLLAEDNAREGFLETDGLRHPAQPSACGSRRRGDVRVPDRLAQG